MKERVENCKGLNVSSIQPLNIPLFEQGERFSKPMSEYNTFLENVYSDELIFVDPDEFDEVNRLMAEEGYHDFSLELEQQLDEQQTWQGSKQFSEVLIKKARSHHKGSKGLRIGGIEI